MPEPLAALTVHEATEVLCEESWYGRWNPLRETNIRPLAAVTVQALYDAGYVVMKRDLGPKESP